MVRFEVVKASTLLTVRGFLFCGLVEAGVVSGVVWWPGVHECVSLVQVRVERHFVVPLMRIA